MNAEKRKHIFERLKTANPNPTTELEYTTPFDRRNIVGTSNRCIGQ